MLFSSSKSSDQLWMIEEEGKPVLAMTQGELKKRLEDGKMADGCLVTQITVIEKYTIVTRKELQKVNGSQP